LKTFEFEENKRIEMKEKHKDKIIEKQKQRQQRQRQREEEEGKEGFTVFVPELKQGQETTGKPSTTTTTRTEPDLSSIPYTILIDTTSSSYPWYDPSSTSSSSTIYTTLESAASARIWNYPLNELQSSKCKIFEDLWRKGYYMGGGLRFGGDFLVYPGDPLRYHSHFTLTVLSSSVTKILPLDLVAYGRLATAVKKAHLLASWNPDQGQGQGKAEYLSLEWAAFG